MTTDMPDNQAEHTLQTREAYDRLAAVWSSTTDAGPFNGLLERPALRALIPGSLHGAAVLDAGCGSGAQAQWLLDQGADVVAVDVSPRMIEEAERRCAGRGRFLVADLAEPLPLEPRSLDGITCSLALHYVADWSGRALARGQAGLGPAPLPGPWALRASLLGLAASAGLAVEILGHNRLSTALTHPSLSRLHTGDGVIAIVELASFAAAALLLRLGRPGLSVVPLLTVVGAEGFRAHPEGVVPVGGAMLTWAHLLPAAMRAGMLFYTVRAAVAWRSDPAAVRRLVRWYSPAAAWLFTLVVVTGVASALVLVPVGSLLATAYGWVLRPLSQQHTTSQR
jgi:SAM-dependent methyltransferase